MNNIKGSAAKIAEGDANKVGRKKLERQTKAAPKPSSLDDECPKHIKGRAKRMWQLWSSELAVMNLDHKPDAAALESVCMYYARAVQLDLLLEKEGLILGHGNDSRKHPAFDMNLKCWMIVKAFCIEFGFTPAARQRMGVMILKNSMQKGNNQEEDMMTALTAPRGRPTLVQPPPVDLELSKKELADVDDEAYD